MPHCVVYEICNLLGTQKMPALAKRITPLSYLGYNEKLMKPAAVVVFLTYVRIREGAHCLLCKQWCLFQGWPWPNYEWWSLVLLCLLLDPVVAPVLAKHLLNS